MLGKQRFVVEFRNPRLAEKVFSIASPCPRIAEPNCRNKVKRGRLTPAIRCREPDQNVVWAGLRVFNNDIEIPILIKYAGVGDFEFRVLLSAAPVLFYQFGVWKFRLRVFVESL